MMCHTQRGITFWPRYTTHLALPIPSIPEVPVHETADDTLQQSLPKSCIFINIASRAFCINIDKINELRSDLVAGKKKRKQIYKQLPIFGDTKLLANGLNHN